MLLGARQFFERRGAPTPPLPYDAEVEWIGQNDQEQYIKTGVVPPVGSILRCEFQFTDTRNSFNAIGNIGNARFGFGIELGTFKVCTAGWKEIIAGKDTNWHTWTIDEPNGIASLDNTSVSINAHSAFTGDVWANNGGFLLFRRLTSSGGDDYSTNGARCKSLYIGTSSVALFDGIPVRFTNELGQSEGAMYDRVSGQLFRNAGTGAFTIGPDKTAWTNPYVTDGLVAMWDGIGNVGWDNHNAASTVWIDLIGENNLAIDSRYASWGDNCLNLNSANVTGTSNQFGASGLAASNVKTIEFVSESIPSTIKNGGVYLSTGYKARGIGGFGGGWIISGVDKSFTAVQNGRCKFFGGDVWYSGMNALSFVYNSEDTNDEVDLYTDGSVFTGTTTFYPSPAAGPFVNTMVRFATLLPVHCIRIYNRALTSSEIAANYAIDKARFNLP